MRAAAYIKPLRWLFRFLKDHECRIVGGAIETAHPTSRNLLRSRLEGTPESIWRRLSMPVCPFRSLTTARPETADKYPKNVLAARVAWFSFVSPERPISAGIACAYLQL